MGEEDKIGIKEKLEKRMLNLRRKTLTKLGIKILDTTLEMNNEELLDEYHKIREKILRFNYTSEMNYYLDKLGNILANIYINQQIEQIIQQIEYNLKPAFFEVGKQFYKMKQMIYGQSNVLNRCIEELGKVVYSEYIGRYMENMEKIESLSNLKFEIKKLQNYAQEKKVDKSNYLNDLKTLLVKDLDKLNKEFKEK